jgi:hypothetical protein
MSMQKILIMETLDRGIRSSAYGWDIECGETALQDLSAKIHEHRSFNRVPVGFAGRPGGLSHTHATPLHAMANGWHLMAPPIKHITDERDYFEWWFEQCG